MRETDAESSFSEYCAQALRSAGSHETLTRRDCLQRSSKTGSSSMCRMKLQRRSEKRQRQRQNIQFNSFQFRVLYCNWNDFVGRPLMEALAGTAHTKKKKESAGKERERERRTRRRALYVCLITVSFRSAMRPTREFESVCLRYSSQWNSVWCWPLLSTPRGIRIMCMERDL